MICLKIATEAEIMFCVFPHVLLLYLFLFCFLLHQMINSESGTSTLMK